MNTKPDVTRLVDYLQPCLACILFNIYKSPSNICIKKSGLIRPIFHVVDKLLYTDSF